MIGETFSKNEARHDAVARASFKTDESNPALNRVPIATYRLQFNRAFTLAQAGTLIPYLRELGISDLYASPLFLAGPESTHGYDVCRFDQINPQLGEPDEFRALTDSLRDHGLGLLLDMVPNHMGNHPSNCWWSDVLRLGRNSPFATFFDINWEARPDQKVLLPVLGDRYGQVLQRGELKLVHENGELHLAYYENRFPLSPESQDKIRAQAATTSTEIHQHLESLNTNLNALNEVIQQQHYRLAFWRVGPHEINYRRFFDVTSLVSVRVEDPPVFAATHRFVFELLQQGRITGLRIDHPDGLRDPKTYFDHLQAGFRQVTGSGDLYVVAEKILSDDEPLPEDWAVSGTTGYDYLNFLNGVFIRAEHEGRFTALYQEFTGTTEDYANAARAAKKQVLADLFPSEVNRLTQRLKRIAEQSLDSLDFTTEELRAAIVEFISVFPVYRTYARAGTRHLVRVEQTYVSEAVRAACQSAPALATVLEFLGKVLVLEELNDERAEFVFRFQQLTGPATAKGLEDTAFYRYHRFISVNEVGGNPGRFGVSLEQFHRHNAQKQIHWPHSLLATATHDTKRGEDVRARLNVISELPEQWEARLREWTNLNRQFLTMDHGERAPSRNDEYLLYQILAGSWTDGSNADLGGYIQRIQQYMEKATREAKLRTSWTDSNAAYEGATRTFLDAILRSPPFRRSLEEFVGHLGFFGIFNSLSQVVLKACSPGVPDFYQGSELWDFNLVDPDNRRSVDYDVRRELLRQVLNRSGSNRTDYLIELMRDPANGAIKLFVTWAALQFRARHREVFEKGNYVPVPVSGSKNGHVIAFARTFGAKTIIAVVPRLPATLMQGRHLPPTGQEIWGDTRLEMPQGPTAFHEALSGRSLATPLAVGDILARFPVALLESV